MSFLRERNLPKGGPDGGDGGRGGSVYLSSNAALNTLADFRYTRVFKATNGRPGEGRNKTGRGGEDCEITVPVGTVVVDADTGEQIGDLDTDGLRLVVAQGGDGGFGNARYKSSTNRAPRKFTPGTPGEVRRLSFELKLLADCGLVGMPNAGKSTLPELGVVAIEAGRSFVVADIPGLIEGAAQGAGLGIQFLRHVTRTRLLLHLVDMAPLDPDRDPVRDIREIEAELEAFDTALATRERWLVMNKFDLMTREAADSAAERLLTELNWQGPSYRVSAVSGQGCKTLMADVMSWIDEQTVIEQEQSDG